MIMTEEFEENRFLKSYLDIGMNKVQVGYNTLEHYSPAMASFVDVAVTKAQEWTPELIQDLTVDGIEYLDELLEAALERAKELKGTLTRDDVVKLIEQLKSEASQAQSQVSGKITAYLPSASIQDYELKEKVNEILFKVLSQPQIIKDKASGLAKNLQSNLDTDKDGKVSVKDLCGATQSATGYLYTACETVGNSLVSNLPKDVLSSSRFEEFVLPLANSYLDSIKTQWKRGEAIKDVFLPLWSAIEVLKAYVTLYATNVHNKFVPLSPYLMELISHTSVVDLPLEIVQILQAASGLVSDKERDSVVKETRALFWALIDISFLLEILKEEKNDTTEPEHNTEGVELVKDAQALQDVSEWATAFTDLKFA